MGRKNGGWTVAPDNHGWTVAKPEKPAKVHEQPQAAQPEQSLADYLAGALLPRTVSGGEGGFVPKFAGDVQSIPGRAIATLAAPGESVAESMARTGGKAGEPAWMQTLDRILRDPVNAVLPGAARAGGALAKMAPGAGKVAMAGRAALAMAPASAAIGGGGGMERISEGKPFGAGEALKDAAIAEGTGLGVAGGIEAGKMAVPAVRRLASALLTKAVKPTKPAIEAGWNAMHVLEDLSESGLPWTRKGYMEGFQNLVDDAVARQAEGKAADIAAGQAAGRPVVVDLNAPTQAGQNAIDQAVQSRSLSGAARFARGAQKWLAEETQVAGLMPRDVSLVDLDAALKTRRGLDKFAYVDNAKGATEARKIGAKATRRAINEILDVVAPRTRAADARLSRLMPNTEGMGAVLERRGNNFLLTPMDITAGVIAGERGGLGAGLATAAAMKGLRTTVPATGAWKLADLLESLPQVRRGAVPLSASAVDNARGGR